MRFAHKINTFYSQGGFAMKRIIMLLLMATMVVYLSGCSIYQGYLSYKQDEELSRERAKERQKVALKEIGEETKVLSQNGNLPGGFPVIFINDSRETVRIFVKKTGSSYRGYTWSFLIPAGEVIEPKLEEGDYFIRWTTQGGYYYNNDFYPRIPTTFPVTRDPHFYYDQTGKNYNGGYQILRNY